MVIEQLLNMLPEEILVWVKERKPKTSIAAGELADDYLQACKVFRHARSALSRRKLTLAKSKRSMKLQLGGGVAYLRVEDTTCD